MKENQQAKIAFPQGYKSKNIYHYTSINGLEGILKNCSLRFTHIGYLNDKDEIIAGMESLAKRLDCSKEDYEKIINEFKNNNLHAFVCCFSLDQDSLPMWNYYTKEINNQGYNISFDDKTLLKSLISQNSFLNNCDISFGQVEYIKGKYSNYSNNYSENMFSQLNLSLSKLILALANMSDKTNTDKDFIKGINDEIFEIERNMPANKMPIYYFNKDNSKFEKQTSYDYVYFVKRDYFNQEKEVRIVVTIPNENLLLLKSEGIYEYRVSNGLLIPHIELKFSQDVIKGITISPTTQSDLAEKSIENYLKYCEFNIDDVDNFVKRSNIPVRF